jgi:hypothetical protein
VTNRLYTVERMTNARAVAGLLRIAFPDAETALDMTWGNGSFWDGSAHVEVTGLDIDSTRARDVVGDFRSLDFAACSFDVAIFDPPFHTNMGRGKASVMGARFKTFATIAELRDAIEAGCREAWRVSRLGVIVKVQNHIHESRLIQMTRWVEDAIPSPLYDELHLQRPAKLLDGKWSDQLSVWRNHSTLMVFRHGDQRHNRRRRPASGGRDEPATVR